MTSALIKATDGVLIEVELPSDQSRPCTALAAKQVTGTVDAAKATIEKVAQSIKGLWADVNDQALQKIEVELGLSFEAGGSIFVAKTKTSAQLVFKLTFSQPTVAPPPASPT